MTPTQKILKVFLLLSLTINVFSQTAKDSINKIIDGKKEGIWLQYLDSLINPTSFENAKYFRYIYYHNGKINKSLSSGFSKKYIVKYTEERQKKFKPLPLDGKYSFIRHRKHSIQKFEEIYENGYPVMFIQYEGDELYEFCDFKKLFNNVPGTFYVETGGKGKVKGYFRDGAKGWTFYFEK